MQINGVICEFNPFHNGHKYLLEKAKEGGAYVICVMSGNFVQRGTFAVCDKFLRAGEAVKYGADLVVELPLPYAVSPAETFARGGVGLLNKLNIVDSLVFGAESSLEEIYDTLRITGTEDFKNKLNKSMENGLSYPDAFFEAAGKTSLCGGNDILALEYIRQLELLGSHIKPIAVRRNGNTHASETPVDEFASASFIRNNIYNKELIKAYMPSVIDANDISDFSKLEFAVLSKLRQMTEDDFSNVADVNEGLEFRLRKAVLEAKSLEDFFEKVRTKRYTLSKIRRIILCSYLGVTKEMQSYIPSFINVLASNDRGVELISLIKKKSSVCPVIRFSDTESLSGKDKELYNFTSVCDDIFGLTLPEIRPVGYDMTHRFSVIKNIDK